MTCFGCWSGNIKYSLYHFVRGWFYYLQPAKHDSFYLPKYWFIFLGLFPASKFGAVHFVLVFLQDWRQIINQTEQLIISEKTTLLVIFKTKLSISLSNSSWKDNLNLKVCLIAWFVQKLWQCMEEDLKWPYYAQVWSSFWVYTTKNEFDHMVSINSEVSRGTVCYQQGYPVAMYVRYLTDPV